MLQAVVFCGGAILMSLEILGSRVLAPSYGSSIFVWGSLIGVVLGALTVGYWLGGVLADARPRAGTLAVILLSAGALVWAIPSLVGPAVRMAGGDARFGPLATAMGLFFLPTLLMGMVSPYAIRLRGPASGSLGRTAGVLYALSAAGSVAGTLGTAFFLIPWLGVAQLIRILGAGLVFLAALALAATATTRRIAVLPALAAVFLVLASGGRDPVAGNGGRGAENAWDSSAPRVIFQKDSIYHRIRVTEDHAARYLLFDNSRQSGMALDDPFRSVFDYTDYVHLGFALRPRIRDVLVIGLGGGLIPKQIWKDHPDSRVDVVEIDPEVVRVARRYFALPEDERLRVYVEDGRRFLEATDRRYDLIVLDAYYAHAIPFHLATREFLELVRSRLRSDGMVAANVAGALAGPRSALFASFYHTVAQVFPERYVFAAGWAREGNAEKLRSIVLLAGSGRSLPPPAMAQAMAAAEQRGVRREHLRRAADLVAYVPDLSVARLLTDDRAPVEVLLRVID